MGQRGYIEGIIARGDSRIAIRQYHVGYAARRVVGMCGPRPMPGGGRRPSQARCYFLTQLAMFQVSSSQAVVGPISRFFAFEETDPR